MLEALWLTLDFGGWRSRACFQWIGIRFLGRQEVSEVYNFDIVNYLLKTTGWERETESLTLLFL